MGLRRPSGSSFQSTPPRREATQVLLVVCVFVEISIHASPKGGDPVDIGDDAHTDHFNPRLPEGRRPQR